MEIFKDELAIADLILANASVACIANVEPAEKNSIPAIASVYTETPNTKDLFYTKSILVSTNLNKNMDYFGPQEVWASRKTCIDKPLNIEHVQSCIVGHSVSAWAIDKENAVLADDIKEIPAFFHLCTASVVYRKWANEELQAQADKLIEEIQAGHYCVSMEALFSNFSYLVVKGDEQKFIPRNENTAFLTKKLKAYGGDGTHDGYQIGRVLHNIIFSGCGFVKKPANPDSIIFAKNQEKGEKTIIDGVYRSCADIPQEKSMSDNILENQVAELKESLKALQTDNKSLNDKLANANTEKLQQELEALKVELAEAQKHMTEKEKMMKDEEDKKKKAEAASVTITEEFAALQVEYEKVRATLDNIKTEASKAARTQKLIEAGLSKEDAQAKAETLAGLSDEQFDAVANALALVKPAKQEQTEDDKAAKAAQELDESEEEEGTDGTISDSNPVEELAAAFATHYKEKFELKESA